MFKNITNKLQEIVLRLEDFMESNIEYYKLRLFKASMKTVVSLVNLIIFGSLFLFVMIFFAIGFALWIGYLIGHSWVGFLIIGGVFLLLVILMLLFGRKLIERKILYHFSGIMHDEDELNPEKATGKDLARLEMSVEKEKLRRQMRKS